MDEIIIRLARAIASHRRLRILSCLAREGERAPTTLATDLGMPLSSLSTCLRMLASVGLIRGRRSGANCYYAFTSPYAERTLSGAMSRWLERLLREERNRHKNCGLLEVRNGPADDGQSSLHATIFDAATAFADLRRLQILRHVEAHDGTTVEDLVKELRMSPYAVSRHTAKLRRRGLLCVQKKAAGRGSYGIVREYKSQVHRRMYQIVRATWAKG